MKSRIPTAAAAPASRRGGGGRLLLYRLGFFVVLVAVWAAVWATELMHRDLVPAPWAVAVELASLFISPAFWLSVLQTLMGALLALLISVAIGVPAGLVLGMLPRVSDSLQFVIDFGRSFPTVAMLPVVILVLGTTLQMKVFVMVAAVLWPILIQTYYGARRLDPVLVDTVRAYGIPRRLMFLKVLLPTAAPFAATGIRIAATVAILVSVGIEILTLTPGMGGALAQSQTNGLPARAIAYTIYAALVALAIYVVLTRVEERLVRWNRRAEVRAS